MDRRTVILDAALEVLAREGARALTHRAVDAAAGIPAGSTSYYFRSRSALVTGCVERLVQIDTAIQAPPPPGDAAGLVTALATAMTGLITTRRTHTVARYELSLAAARDPALRAELLVARSRLHELLATMLGGLGATDPAASAEEVAATMDGVLLSVLLRGSDDVAATTAMIHRAADHVVRAQPGVR